MEEHWFGDERGVVVRRVVVVGAEAVRGEDASLSAARLRRLLDEPLTRPLGSMSPRCFGRPAARESDEESALVQRWSESERFSSEELLPLIAAGPVFQVDRPAGTQPALPRARRAVTLSRGGRGVASARTRMSAPTAPPRSSAVRAGVVDGWERLPHKLDNTRPGARHQRWAIAGVLGVFTMVLVFALTWHLVP